MSVERENCILTNALAQFTHLVLLIGVMATVVFLSALTTDIICMTTITGAVLLLVTFGSAQGLYVTTSALAAARNVSSACAWVNA